MKNLKVLFAVMIAFAGITFASCEEEPLTPGVEIASYVSGYHNDVGCLVSKYVLKSATFTAFNSEYDFSYNFSDGTIIVTSEGSLEKHWDETSGGSHMVQVIPVLKTTGAQATTTSPLYSYTHVQTVCN